MYAKCPATTVLVLITQKNFISTSTYIKTSPVRLFFFGSSGFVLPPTQRPYYPFLFTHFYISLYTMLHCSYQQQQQQHGKAVLQSAKDHGNSRVSKKKVFQLFYTKNHLLIHTTFTSISGRVFWAASAARWVTFESPNHLRRPITAAMHKNNNTDVPSRPTANQNRVSLT